MEVVMTKIDLNKINTKLMYASLFIVLLTSLSMVQPFSYGTIDPQNLSSSSSGCVDKDSQEAHSKASTQDIAKAISLATGQSEFQAKIKGYKSTFNSIFNEWSFDVNCNLTWKDVGIVYTITNATGFAKNVVVIENPSLTKVMNVTVQETGRMISSTNWDGYEFYKSLPPSAVNVWEAKASWTQTTVNQPAAGYCVAPTPCAISTWPGLSDLQGGGNCSTTCDLAQAGTTGQITCIHSGCNTINYFAWYEFLPANYVTCSSFTLNKGDSVSSDIVNHAKSGGSNTLYDITVADSTSGSMCTVSSHTYSIPSPLYATFINERPIIGGVTQSLPKFTSITMTGSMYYSGALNSISVPYNAGTYNQYNMVNGGNNNISLGGASTGSFTATWSTSAGT
jgi:hypothetical protein